MDPQADPVRGDNQPRSLIITPEVWRVEFECLDATAAPQALAELCRRLEGAPQVIDLAAVRFADSVGIALLARAHARNLGRVWLSNVSVPLQRCLKRAPPGTLPPTTTSSQPCAATRVIFPPDRLRGPS